MDIDDNLLQKLRTDNEEFKKLHDQHLELKSKVDELSKLKFMSPEQEIEKKNHQKEKLILKDRMGKIVSQYQGELH